MRKDRPLNTMRAYSLAVAFAALAVSPVMGQGADGQEPGAVDVRSPAAETVAPANAAVYRAAQEYRGAKILVSTNERRLLLISRRDTLLDVPVAIGMARDFEYEGRTFRFETPTGRRKVLSKSEEPVWTVPEWHYMEKAAQRGLELVRLKADDRVELEDGTFLVVRGDQVGRINQFGNFWAITPGKEIVFDGRIFVPPFGTEQRRVPDALGPYKLDMGDGYLIHGTNRHNEDSIGLAVSHGCVRMMNRDLDRLYWMTEPGTPVFIY